VPLLRSISRSISPSPTLLITSCKSTLISFPTYLSITPSRTFHSILSFGFGFDLMQDTFGF